MWKHDESRTASDGRSLAPAACTGPLQKRIGTKKMTNKPVGSRPSCLGKRLRRLEDCLARPEDCFARPKETEALRLRW